MALVDEAGKTRARYGELYVTDAGGDLVPAWLEVEGERIAIAVDDRGARYPLSVDPFVWSEK